MRVFMPVAVLLCCCSCESSPHARGTDDQQMFGPVAMRIHPIFTEPKDWTGDGNIDGIEALVELTDQFGDSTKARGQVVFELSQFRRYNPDPRGEPMETWVVPIRTLKEQKDWWRRIGGAYAFQLPFPTIAGYGATVLSAEITLDTGGRLRDRVVLQNKK